MKFNRLLESESEFAGHSMWHYISQTYGATAVANLLYMTRVNRSIENGFMYVLGVNLKKLTSNWLAYNQKYYENEEKNRSLPQGDPLVKKPKRNVHFSKIRLSPDGNYVAYVKNDLGKYKVFMTDMRRGKTRKVLKGGFKSLQQRADHSFPLLAWHPSGQFLSVMKEKKGKIWLEYYKPGKRKPDRNKFFYFDKVLDFSYSPNGQEIVLSGNQNGQSDIYVFNTRSRTSQNLTDDFYDDLQPSFTADGKGILFVSNRINDTLHIDKSDEMPAGSNLDLFQLDYPARTNVLKRITNTPLVNESQPLPADSGRVYYLSDANGIVNRYLATVDSTISFIDTVEHYRYYTESYPQSNYSRNIEDHSISLRQNKYAELIYLKGRYRIHVNPAPPKLFANALLLDNTQTRQLSAKRFLGQKRPVVAIPKPLQPVIDSSFAIKEEPSKPKPAAKDSSKIDINNYIFQSEFMKPRPKKDTPKNEGKDTPSPTGEPAPAIPSGKAVAEIPADSFRLPKQRNYDIAFATDYFVTQLDNSLQNSTYQAFTGSAFYFDPGLNILFKVGVADLMNDYKITGGFRISGDLNSNEYFLDMTT